MNYEEWRITYQSSEQAARAAFAAWQKKAEKELCGCQQGHVCGGCDPDAAAPKLVVKDLKIEYLFTQLGGGFAPVSTSGIKITHVPSGLSVESTEHRSQHRNRQAAIEQLQMLVSSHAVAETGQKPAEWEPVGCFFKNDRGFWHQAGDPVGFKGLTKLYAAPQPCPDCLKWATDMSQVTKTLRYLIGIAERGTATTLPDGVTVESFVLDYVKGLEAKVAELTQDLQTTSDALGHAESNDRELIEEQQGTIKALNIALGGEDSTSTENLIDAHEVDFDENGLIALCRKLIAENVRMGDTVEFQKAGWSADYDKLTRAEAVIEKSAIALSEVESLISESSGIYGLHLNGDVSPWSEIEQGGRFERLCAIPEALAAITEYREGK